MRTHFIQAQHHNYNCLMILLYACTDNETTCNKIAAIYVTSIYILIKRQLFNEYNLRSYVFFSVATCSRLNVRILSDDVSGCVFYKVQIVSFCANDQVFTRRIK